MNGSENEQKEKYQGTLRRHWLWSILLALTLLILDGILLATDHRSGLVAVAFTAFYFLAVLGIYFYYKPRILQDMVNFASGYGQVLRHLLDEFEIPVALMEPEGKVLWMSERMRGLTDKKRNFRKNISTLFPELGRGLFPRQGESRDWDINVTFKEKIFRAHIQRINLEELAEPSSLADAYTQPVSLYLMYLIDETQLLAVMKENRDSKNVVSLIYLDNYDEVMEHTDEVHQSLLNVLAERKISKYFEHLNCLVKKMDKDKYLAVMDQQGLDILRSDRFSLMDGVKTISIGNEMKLTVSIGVGTGGKTYQENYDFARSCIELALGRGGDQTVIKDGEETIFFGGKTQRSERSTYVKARVKAQALRELILSRDTVVAMGHTNTDMDAFGAAVGVCRAAMTVGKPAHIVLGELNFNIRDWVAAFQKDDEYPQDFFITHEQAMELTDENTTVVVVDTNQPGRVECREILSQAGALVVLDHHRQAAGVIENAALSYIEPSASSACEMIAEILQYFEDNVRLRALEADCIYAGIIIDTHSFAAKTGVRTFEAAAYLRRSGADVIRVRKALRDDLGSYKARAYAVSHAEDYMGCYAISICDASGTENPNVVGAQAANELLNIVGVKASFVVTPLGDKAYISARSIDEINVQLVMERMGGGGHMNIAGAQLDGVTAEEAVARIKEVLRAMTEEGAI